MRVSSKKLAVMATCAGFLISAGAASAAPAPKANGQRAPQGPTSNELLAQATASTSKLISVKYLQPASTYDDDIIAGGLASLAEGMAAQHCGEPASLDAIWSLVGQLNSVFYTFADRIFSLDTRWGDWTNPNLKPCEIVIQAAKASVLFYGFEVYSEEPYVLLRTDEVNKYYCQYRIAWSFSSSRSSTPINFYGPRPASGCGPITLSP